jgi:Holliday junction resolvase
MKLNVSDSAILKAERNVRADRQEEQEVKALRDKGYKAYRVDREVDSISAKHGMMWVCDSKYSDNDIFYIAASDVDKGLDEAAGWSKALNGLVPVGFRVDMHFPRHRNKRRYIEISEERRGQSIRVICGAKRITTSCEAGNSD